MRAPALNFALNPLLSREVRARWRDERSFALVLTLTACLSLIFVRIYGGSALSPVGASHGATPNQAWALLGHEMFGTLTWIQVVAWLLLSPALTSSSIAYERERGWFDSILLSPLLPRQIALGKWVSALLFAAILALVTLPFWALILLLGGVSPGEFWLALLLHALCAAFGAAVGLAASAWSVRSHVALRSAYSFLLLWLASSTFTAGVTGSGPLARLVLRLLGPQSPPPFYVWWGSTNPISLALELSSPGPEKHFSFCFSFLAAATVFFLAIATYYCRKPLQEAPFIESPLKLSLQSRARKKTDAKSVATHSQIPLLARLKFQNPVLDREVRAKFRMRQPPLAVIIVEGVLGVLVALFYGRTLWMAIFQPASRFLVWWGLIFTGLIVSMMAAAVMGGNGFSREREGGTWEGISLSLLSPGEILRGKMLAPLLSCALFSLPVWPLLLPCIAWNAGLRLRPAPFLHLVGPLQAAACLLVWAATVWSFTAAGLWIGRNQTRSSRAAGQSLGFLAAGLILSPLLAMGTGSTFFIEALGVIHPFVALSMSSSGYPPHPLFVTGLPYFFFHGLVGCLILRALQRNLSRELSLLPASR